MLGIDTYVGLMNIRIVDIGMLAGFLNKASGTPRLACPVKRALFEAIFCRIVSERLLVAIRSTIPGF